ncbi:MAG: transglutaminase-like domain-containing protein [Gammaproteobacteria bacterium]
MQEYLDFSPVIDGDHPAVAAKAAELAHGAPTQHELVRRCFEFVRDQVKHSRDYMLGPVTCKASDVLQHGTGYCYAKSHLLAALLRANGVPTALCYQRLSCGDKGAPYCLHGLNAVHLDGHGWYRIDARGNKPGVDAQFVPPREQLAFPIQDEHERDLPGLYAEALPQVVDVLTTCTTVDEVARNLPDLPQ